MLKADLHIHTREDPLDYVPYTAKEIINLAASRGYDVLSLTCHNKVIQTKELEDYAKSKGIILIPGAELTIKGKHVLVYNITDEERKQINDLSDIPKHAIVCAPHPYYLMPVCLGKILNKEIHRFHAIEYYFCHTKLINPNKRAVRIGEKYGKTLIGSSDLHDLEWFGYTYTLIQAKKEKEAILRAILEGDTRVISHPLPMVKFIKVALKSIF